MAQHRSATSAAGEVTLASLAARIDQLEAQLAARTSPTPSRAQAAAAPRTTTDRRGLLRLAGGAAMGVAVGLSAAGRPAAADDGLPLMLGDLAGNDCLNTTGIVTDIAAGPGVAGFAVIDRSLAAFPGSATIAGHSNGRFGNAVFGYHQGAGAGVCGQVDGSGAGLIGYAPNGLGGVLQGGRANGRFVPAGLPPLERTDSHVDGELLLDANGDLWLCIESGSPGRWRFIAGHAPPPRFEVVNPPVRLYDSRPGFAPLNVQKGAFAAGEERDILFAPTGVSVPDGALAFVNVTVTETGSGGFVSAYRSGQPWPGTSTVNWSGPNQNVANLALLPIVGNLFRARASEPTHLVADLVTFVTPKIVIDSD